jgi:RNA polymerase sigma-70 factor (ECF subfamily)
MESRSEKELIRRMQQGDRRAFEAFIDAYGARVHRLARRYVANPSDAEDLTQEIFADLYRSIGGFRGDAALATWVYRVAVNRCLRHCQRHRGNDLPYEDQRAQPDDDWRTDPAQSAAKRELADRVQGALRELSPPHQEIVILHELHGLTYQECASVLDIPVGTVKSRLSNAFRRLRESLSGYILGERGALPPETDAVKEGVR